MKDFLAPVKNNKVVKVFTTELGKFYVNHESAILTGGTIGFSLATTALTIKNSRQINYIIDLTRNSLAVCQTKEERNEVYADALKGLAPLVLPIMLFQAATIGCALYSKKQSDKKLAAAASALSIANEAVARYQAFQKETEKALGEKKYQEVQDEIYNNQVVDGRRFATLPLEGAPGEILIIDGFTGRPFWSTRQQVEWAVEKACDSITPDDNGNVRNDYVSIDDIHGLIGNKDLTDEQVQSDLTPRFGYPAGEAFSARFTDTHYCFPNGTVIPAFRFLLYPEPGCIDWGC